MMLITTCSASHLNEQEVSVEIVARPRASRTKGVRIMQNSDCAPRQKCCSSAEKTDSSQQGSIKDEQLATDPCNVYVRDSRMKLHQFDRLKVWELVDKTIWHDEYKLCGYGRTRRMKIRLKLQEHGYENYQTSSDVPKALLKADMFTKALPEDRFKYLVRRIGMRCLTPTELEVLTNEPA
ncbi:hypothetical protein Tco_0752465 [Tanacetum coccineum]|uniref:Uncharacterized protein n=1 Tax=Tanacetum coccineum TaxID=301880 RepID=A0ABQ4Z6X6_9ASTR